jgi:hypothetical protein
MQMDRESLKKVEKEGKSVLRQLGIVTFQGAGVDKDNVRKKERKEQWADLTICAIINMQEQCIGLNIKL